MRREPLVYALLLVASLAVAFRTWTHGARTESAPNTVEPWHEQTDALLALDYTRPGEHLEIRRLGQGESSYLWATVDTSAFVVGGESGQRLLQAMATPHALRDLGVPAAAQRDAYGLDTAKTRLVVSFQDGSRELLVGGKAYYSGERYVLDRASGHVFVLPGDALTSLDNAAQMLPERRLHAFSSRLIASVTLRGAGRTLAMHRLEPAGGAGTAAGPAAWAPAAGPQRPDPAFGTFLQRLDGLWAAGYAAREDPRKLQPIMRVDYADRHEHPLGFLELFRRPGSGSPGSKPAAAQYFVRTELTRVLVRLYPGAGDNLANDVAQRLAGHPAAARRSARSRQAAAQSAAAESPGRGAISSR